MWWTRSPKVFFNKNFFANFFEDKDEEKVAGGSSEGRRSADEFNIDVHEPEVKRQKTVSTAKKVICKSLKGCFFLKYLF